MSELNSSSVLSHGHFVVRQTPTFVKFVVDGHSIDSLLPNIGLAPCLT